MPAEMIAMLDGLGAYGQNAVGDVDPRLLPSRVMSPPSQLTAGPVPTYPPRPYRLGALGNQTSEDTSAKAEEGMGKVPKLLIAVGGISVLVWAMQKASSPKSPPPQMNGYPEPEMIDVPRPKRRRRRKK